MYVFDGRLPTRIHRVDLGTGRRILLRDITPRDAAGVFGIDRVVMTRDGRSYFYSYRQLLSELFLVDGVK
jgi:hypothetical protein